METHTESFSRLWDGYATDEEARVARDERYFRLTAQVPGTPGMHVRRMVLKDQCKKYDGFGKYNGGVCDVFQIVVEEP